VRHWHFSTNPGGSTTGKCYVQIRTRFALFFVLSLLKCIKSNNYVRFAITKNLLFSYVFGIFKTMMAYLIVDVKINFLVHYIKIKTMSIMFTPLVSSNFSYVNITFQRQLYYKLYQNSISMM